MSQKEKGRKWDGKSRISNDLYRKNFNKIFGVKEKSVSELLQEGFEEEQNGTTEETNGTTN
jgi:hypothetical protein|tara:strand:- start:322 stop:504 length:183 start_codon:yes stop_codon:yes gene_type:complete